ncbi:18245_t:CDS:2, partial [Racocetra persica]
FEEVLSQEPFKGEQTFERMLSQKTFEETTPQDMYREIQHEPEIFISDLEILNDGASFQVTSKRKGIFKGFSSQETFIERMPQDIYMDLENLNNETSTELIPQDLYMDVHESKIFIPDLENLNDKKYSPKVTPKKWTLDNSYSQDKEISKFTKYNNGDSARTFRESNTDLSENLSLSNVKIYNKIPDDQKINLKNSVTTFVRAVLKRVIPEDFWGCNDNQQ